MNSQPLILLADDSENEIFLFELAIAKAGLSNPIVAVQSGQLALDYIGGRPPFTDRSRYPLPSLILLDIKMPFMDGFEVLTRIQCSPSAHIPIVMLSSSENPSEVAEARRIGASDCHIKPHSHSELVQLVRDLHNRWLDDVSKEN